MSTARKNPQANARLIAAAPDLLEALKEALAYIEASAANNECRAMNGKEWAEAKREAENIGGLSVGRWAGDEVRVNLSDVRAAIARAERR